MGWANRAGKRPEPPSALPRVSPGRSGALIGATERWQASPVSESRAAVPGPEDLAFESVTVDGEGGRRILDQVTCRLPLRGISVVLGASGAGKTTLLRLCNRLEVPSSGRVVLAGVDIADLDPLELRRRVGMIFQHPRMFGGTVRDNLEVARGARARGPTERRAPTLDPGELVAVLAVVGLDAAFLDRRADQLSGGEAQRVCVARALLTHPELVLMDEPTSSLDPEHTEVIERLARDLAARGLGVVWVTHDLDQAERLADRTLVLVDGHVATADEAAAFVARRAGGRDG
jgi:putative ABC transport system ATP-binding protein